MKDPVPTTYLAFSDHPWYYVSSDTLGKRHWDGIYSVRGLWEGRVTPIRNGGRENRIGREGFCTTLHSQRDIGQLKGTLEPRLYPEEVAGQKWAGRPLCLTCTDPLAGTCFHMGLDPKALQRDSQQLLSSELLGKLFHERSETASPGLQRVPVSLFFFFPISLRYNWHVTLYYFKVHNIMIWYVCLLENDYRNHDYVISILSHNYKIFSCYKNFHDLLS